LVGGEKKDKANVSCKIDWKSVYECCKMAEISVLLWSTGKIENPDK